MKIRTFIMGDILTNTYFVIPDEGDEIIVIDPGMDGEAIYKKLLEKGWRCRFILLTHGHFDHSMGAAYLRKMTGAQVVCHKFDVELLSDSRKNAADMYYGRALDSYPDCICDIPVSDGDIITLGDVELKVIHTPGHTNGSVLYLGDKVVFTGDTVFAGSFGRTDLYGGSSETLAASLELVAALDPDLKLCPGHGNSCFLRSELLKIPGYIRYLE